MTSTAIILLTIAAVLHVAWNLGGRISGPTPQFFRVVTAYTCMLLAPVMIIGFPVFQSARPEIWLYFLVSGLFQAIYFSGLSGAYMSGHLSVAYPLARTWPALFVVLVSVVLGRGDAITSLVVVGILLVLAGSTALPLGSIRELRLSTYWNRSCAYALLAAVGTTGYTIVDDAGLREITSVLQHPHWQIACLWLGYESLSTVIWLKVFERLHIFQASIGAPIKISRWRAGLVALAMGSTYALVLLSYTMVDDVSYVAGFRQLSVPLGAVAGIVILREPGPPLKMLGVTFMFAGLIVIALG